MILSKEIQNEIATFAANPQIAQLAQLAVQNNLDFEDPYTAMNVLNYQWEMNGNTPAKKIGSVLSAVKFYLRNLEGGK